MAQQITVETSISAPIGKVWASFTEPAHITKWCTGSPDWHTPTAENDLRVGGRFKNHMEAKDGSQGFDMTGVYDIVTPHERIDYTMDDRRKVSNVFTQTGGETRVVTTFDAETENPIEVQRGGWQTILDNFKRYVESQ